MKTKNIVHSAAAFLAAFFSLVICGCSSTKNAKRDKQQMTEVRRALPVAKNRQSKKESSDDKDLAAVVSYMKKGGLGKLLAEAKAKAALPPTGYAGEYKVYASGVEMTDVGKGFAIPERSYLGKPPRKIGDPEQDFDAYERTALFVDSFSVVTLHRVDGRSGNKIFCFSEKTDTLVTAEISDSSVFVVEDTDELNSGGERLVKVRAAGINGHVYEAHHRAPPLLRVKKREKGDSPEIGSEKGSGSAPENIKPETKRLRELMRKPRSFGVG